jgi:hypothetical protein
MVARTLKLNEIVYVISDDTPDMYKGKITAIDFKQKDFHFSGDEKNVDVEIELTEILMNPSDVVVGEHIHVNNQEVYQIVPDKHYQGDEVCYEFREEYLDEGAYFSPMEEVNFDEKDFDENEPQWVNKQYSKEDLLAMCERFGNGDVEEMAAEYADDYDYESDTLDAREAVHDAVVYGIKWALEHLK